MHYLSKPNMKPHGLKIVLEQGRILALRSAKSKVCARTGFCKHQNKKIKIVEQGLIMDPLCLDSFGVQK
jgi:hypothetical protein